MKRLFFLFLILLSPKIVFSKKEGKDLIDSILKVLPNAKDDTNKVMLLDKLTNAFGEDFADESIIYDLQQLELAQKLGWTRGILLAFGHMGDDYSTIGDHKNELIAFSNGLRLTQIKKDSLHELKFLVKLGFCYRERKDYDSALACYIRILSLCDRMGIKNKYFPFINLCDVYTKLHQYSLALANGFEAIKSFDSVSNVPLYLYGTVGLAYFGAATDTTFKLHADSLLLQTKAQNLSKAIEYLNLGRKRTNELDVNYVNEVYSDLTTAYTLIGDYPSAFAVLKDGKEIADSLIKTANVRAQQVSALVAQLKGQRIQQDLKEIKLKGQAQLLLAVALCLMLVTSLFIFRNYKTQKKYNALLGHEKRQALEKVNSQSDLLTEIAYTQAHDVRGPLSTIMGLADLYNYDRPEDPTNAELVQGIATTAQKLDAVVTAIVKKENDLKAGKDRL